MGPAFETFLTFALPLTGGGLLLLLAMRGRLAGLSHRLREWQREDEAEDAELRRCRKAAHDEVKAWTSVDSKDRHEEN